jgi:hypothetical protein
LPMLLLRSSTNFSLTAFILTWTLYFGRIKMAFAGED